MDKIEQFKKEYCSICGTQRCTSEGEWLEACPEYKKFMNETQPATNPPKIGIDLVQVVKKHIEEGGNPTHRVFKSDIRNMCGKLGIKSISQFYDMLFDALKMRCPKNFWQHPLSPCLDSEGDHIAYGKDTIAKAMEKNERDLTCRDISEVCGSCAYINKIASDILHYLVEQMDDKGLKLDE